MSPKKADYLARLRKHDWSYMMSDDNQVYRRGQAATDALKAEGRTPELEGMYEKYSKWWWNDRSAGHPEPSFED